MRVLFKNRESAFQTIIAAFLFFCLPASALSILQGATDATSTQIAILHPTSMAIDATMLEEGTLRVVAAVEKNSHGWTGDPASTTKLLFEGLKPGVDYTLQVSEEGKLIEKRRLRTLDPRALAVRFAVASCMDDGYAKEQAGMWRDLLSHDPDVVFLIGDNVYTDSKPWGSKPAPAVIWRRYAETRAMLQLFQADRLVPTLATWDDHDYGANDGDRTFVHKDAALKIFLSFFPQDLERASFKRGPGVSSLFTAFGQKFFLMDDRTFRSPVKEEPETHWGTEQENWFFREIGSHPVPSWILNGDQIFGAYHRFESWEGRHPKNLAAFLKRVKRVRAPVAFISGDRHLTELMQIEKEVLGYTTYELTTSAIHAATYPNAWDKTPNKRKIEGVSGQLNYAIVESLNESGGISAVITAYGPNDKVHYIRDIRVSKK